MKSNTKKSSVFFAVGTKEYSKYAIPFWRSMVNFHSPKDIDMLWYTDEKDPKVLERLPEGIKTVDITPYLADPAFFFRQKPILAEPLLDDYELVVGFDTDMLIVGDLNFVLDSQDYDVGVAYNWNRFDQQFYPAVELIRIGIAPAEYFNAGFVAMRSKKFVHNWLVDCFSPQFDRMQYREQDILNILCYYGNYNVRCFDLPETKTEQGMKFGWYGLMWKGEGNRAFVKDKKIYVEKGLGDTPYPPETVQLHIVSLGGGHGAIKDNWAAFFPLEIMIRIQELIK